MVEGGYYQSRRFLRPAELREEVRLDRREYDIAFLHSGKRIGTAIRVPAAESDRAVKPDDDRHDGSGDVRSDYRGDSSLCDVVQ